MLDYTIVAAQKTVNDIKRLSRIFAFSTQLLYIVYLIYALVLQLGFMWLNIVLLSVSLAYFVFFIFANGKNTKKIKAAKKSVRHSYKIIKISASSFNLAVLLYSIYAFPSEVKPISIVLATLMTVLWVLQLVIELFSAFAESRVSLLLTALEADFEAFMRPLSNAQNFVRKIKGEEPTQEREEPSHIRKMLDERVEERRADRKLSKLGKRKSAFDFILRKKPHNNEEREDAKEFAKK